MDKYLLFIQTRPIALIISRKDAAAKAFDAGHPAPVIGNLRLVSNRLIEYWLYLERLTEPFDLVERNEAYGESGEGLVDVAAPFVADGQAARAVEPSVGTLADLTVTPEPLAALDAFAGDSRYDPACPILLAPCPGIIGFVGVQLAWPPAGSPAPSISQGWDASSVWAIITLSCRLAPLRRNLSGVPRASVTRWRFMPGLLRFVGFGPVEELLLWPVQTRCSGSPGSSRSHRPRASALVGPDAGAP